MQGRASVHGLGALGLQKTHDSEASVGSEYSINSFAIYFLAARAR